MAFSKKSDVTATLGEFGIFDEYSGGAFQIQHTDYVPAGKKAAIKLPGTHAIDDITLGRAFDPNRDLALLDWYNKYQQGKEQHRTCVIQYLNPQGGVQKTVSHPRCVPKTLTMPQGKSGDNSVAEVVLVLGVEAVN